MVKHSQTNDEFYLKEHKCILFNSLFDKYTLQEEVKRRTYLHQEHSFSSVFISEHAHARWNERVGPKIEYETLCQMMNVLILELHRVEFINHQFALIDDEIVFIYEKDVKNNQLLILTFYGRISVLPFLMNIEALRKFNLKNDELINLKVADRIVVEQKFPIIPCEILRFDERRNSFLLEKYKGENGFFLYLFKIDSTGKCITEQIDLKNPYKTFNRKVLKAIEMLGFSDFIAEHKKYYKNKMSKRF